MVYETEEGYEDPALTQISAFLQNRVGQLAELLKILAAEGAAVHGLSIQDSIDFAVVRLIVDRAEKRLEQLRKKGIFAAEGRVLGVQLERERTGPLDVCRALIQAEINIHYMYPLFTQPRGKSVIIVNIESLHSGVDVLRRAGFKLLDALDLISG